MLFVITLTMTLLSLFLGLSPPPYNHYLFASFICHIMTYELVALLSSNKQSVTLIRLLCPIVYHNLSTYNSPYLTRQQPFSQNGRPLG